MLNILLFFKGFYSIVVSGFGAERFINLCRLKNITLWDLKLSGQNEYHMKITVQDYNTLEEIINKTGVTADIQKKYGLPFLFQGKKNRLFYLIFICIAVFLIFFSNRFVWKIEYEGNYSITEEQLKDFLYENGVREGIKKEKIPYEVLEENLRLTFPVIKWCSVSLKGNTLTLRVEENTLLKDKEGEITDFIYSDIVAENDGEIISVMVRNGLSLVKAGDSVKKGQILVTGAVPVYNDDETLKKYHYYDADADVFIKSEITYEENLDTDYLSKEYTGRKTQNRYLKIGDINIQFPKKVSFAYYDTYVTTQRFSLFHRLFLPVYYGIYEYREYYLIQKKYTDEEVVFLFNKNLSNYYARLEEKGVQILENNVKIEHNEREWILKGDFTVSVYNTLKEYRKIAENEIQ